MASALSVAAAGTVHRPADAHRKAAVESGSHTGSQITSEAESPTQNQDMKKPLEIMPIDASQGFVMTDLVPPQGLEPWTR